MKIRWTLPASSDFEAALDYLAAERVQAARKLSRLTVKAEAHLRAYPRTGRPGRVAGTREWVLAGMPYVVVYRVGDAMIEVLRFLHQNQLWPPSDTPE